MTLTILGLIYSIKNTFMSELTMPRLREIPRDQASDDVLKFYDAIFGERDPVAEPGTATARPVTGGLCLH